MNIPERRQNEGFFAYVRRLMATIPTLPLNKAKEYAKGTKRTRSSKYQPHQGERECARRRLQMARGII